MDFSWATISLIDIGIFSFGIIAAATGWIVKKREDQRYNALYEEHKNLQQRYNALQQEFSNFQSAADQRYNALQQEHEILKEENATLRAGLDALTREHKALQTAHDRLSGRHAELVERVMPVFEILAREN
ncbi:MAG: hypothetical protein OXH39_00725 [Candidatus Poribacteria bacterium]|nr:hypothetical protein [Candidatus Poribacteria bacterium]